MKRTVLVASLLVVCPVWAVLGQQSGGLKISVKGGEQAQGGKDKNDHASQVQKKTLTNADVLQMAQAKLSDAVVIATINNSACKFSTGPQDLIDLKKAGVSDAVLEAMMGAEAGPSAGAGANPLVPQEHGMYYQGSTGLSQIEGQVISFARTGSLLSSAATFGIKSRKINVQIMGEMASHTTGLQPVFYYRVASGNDSAGGSAGDLVLVCMSVKHKRRQFEVAAGGAWRASSGISIRSQLKVTRKQIEPGLYVLTPAEGLNSGQYGLYLFRGYDLPGYVYDFTAE